MKNRDCPYKLALGCPCALYSKEMLCDFPYLNSNREYEMINRWGHRIPAIKQIDKVARPN